MKTTAFGPSFPLILFIAVLSCDYRSKDVAPHSSQQATDEDPDDLLQEQLPLLAQDDEDEAQADVEGDQARREYQALDFNFGNIVGPDSCTCEDGGVSDLSCDSDQVQTEKNDIQQQATAVKSVADAVKATGARLSATALTLTSRANTNLGQRHNAIDVGITGDLGLGRITAQQAMAYRNRLNEIRTDTSLADDYNKTAEHKLRRSNKKADQAKEAADKALAAIAGACPNLAEAKRQMEIAKRKLLYSANLGNEAVDFNHMANQQGQAVVAAAIALIDDIANRR
jgi:hypothetical protein